MSENVSKKPEKKRNINFTEAEKRVLANEYIRHEKIINGEFSPTLTNEHKNHAWGQVAEAVNAVAPTYRSMESLKSKWKEMKRITKQKVSNNKREMAKTGGGVAKILELSTVDRLVETTIGKASLHGVGGMDTLKATLQQPRMERNNNKMCPATITRPVGELLVKDRPCSPTSQPLANPATQKRPLSINESSTVKIIHIEPLDLEQEVCRTVMAHYSLNSPPPSPEPWPVSQPAAEQYPLGAEEDNPDDPDTNPDATPNEPQKKRPRVRRTAEEIKLAVVSNQATLNDNVLELKKELKRRNDISEKMLDLKREKIRQNETQHHEAMVTQTSIASSLAQILSILKKE